MITMRQVHPSGALELSAMVMGTVSRQVWLERQMYYGYNKHEARSKFRTHLVESGFVLVND